MPLHIVGGPSGAGKSHTVYSELIAECVRHPERDYLVIVPEQATMQVQKELVRMHPRGGLLNVDVLSFNRLAYRIFEEVGGDEWPILDDIGKSLLIQKVMGERISKLPTLHGMLAKKGAVAEMKSLLSELLQYRVRPEDLEDFLAARKGDDLLSHKLADIRLVYEGFLDELKERYLTTEEVPEVLASVLPRSAYIKNCEVIFDGFTGFTPVQLSVVRAILSLCREVTLLVTADSKEDLTRKANASLLFDMSRQMAQDLMRLAGEVGCEIAPVRMITRHELGRFRGNETLARLEENLFRRRAFAFEGDPQSIRIVAGRDPRDEMRYAAREITRLVREEGWRYGDFAVISGDASVYGRAAKEVFAEAGIPCFIDRKPEVAENRGIAFVQAAVDLVRKRFSYESVFRFLRTGFFALEEDEIDRMENYVLATGIRSQAQYEERWIRIPKNGRAEELPALDALRERFAAPVVTFAEALRRRGGTVREKTEVLHDFLRETELQEKLAKYAALCEARHDENGRRAYEQVYPFLIGLFDQMVAILGDVPISLDHYAELLAAGFSEGQVGLLPQGEDVVIVGDIERTRLGDIRALIFAGLNEGIVPRAASSAGILTEADRTALAAHDISLAPDSREEMFRQRFYLYLHLTKPCDLLVLSFAERSLAQAALLPSYLISAVRKLFPGCVPLRAEAASDLQSMTGPERARCLIEGLQTLCDIPPSDDYLALAGAYVRSDKGALEKFRSWLSAAAAHNPREGISPSTARALYRDGVAYSVTRLERFSSCAFKHFCEYGLKLSPREIYEFTAADAGSILHGALERFSLALAKDGIAFTQLSDEERNRRAEEALDAIVHDYGNTILHSTSRYQYQIARLSRVLSRTVWAITEQIARGDFVPYGAEFVFGEKGEPPYQLTLPDGGRISLHGRIDRIDFADADGVRYVRVIDYKTSDTKLRLDRLYEGLQLQLPLYLDAVIRAESEKTPSLRIEPAGIFYYHISDPLIEPADAALLEAKRFKALMLRGLSRAEDEVLVRMDHALLEAGGGSSVISVKRNQDGALAKGSKAASAEQFGLIRRFGEAQIREIGSRMREGQTQALPYADGEQTGCKYCAYRGICGFDERIPGYRFRRIAKRGDEEVFDLMRASLAGSADDRKGEGD